MNRPRILGVSNSTRKIRRLIFQRRRVIAPSIAPSRILFNKPAGSLVCRAKKKSARRKRACLTLKRPRKEPSPAPLAWYEILRRSQRPQAAQPEAKKDSKDAEYDRVPCNKPDHCSGASDRIPQKQNSEDD